MTREQHLLTKLSEECGELVQIASKTALFGLNSVKPSTGVANSTALTTEARDVIALIDLLIENDTLDGSDVYDAVETQRKKDKVEHYYKYSQQAGLTNVKGGIS